MGDTTDSYRALENKLRERQRKREELSLCSGQDGKTNELSNVVDYSENSSGTASDTGGVNDMAQSLEYGACALLSDRQPGEDTQSDECLARYLQGEFKKENKQRKHHMRRLQKMTLPGLLSRETRTKEPELSVSISSTQDPFQIQTDPGTSSLFNMGDEQDHPLRRLLREHQSELQINMGDAQEHPLGRLIRSGTLSLQDLLDNSDDSSANSDQQDSDVEEEVTSFSRTPMHDVAIRRLPTYQHRGGLTVEKSSCDVCFSQFENGEDLKRLPCFHVYHATCIDKWLKINGVCPVCRLHVNQKDQG